MFPQTSSGLAAKLLRGNDLTIMARNIRQLSDTHHDRQRVFITSGNRNEMVIAVSRDKSNKYMKTYWLYILKCSDGRYYTGSISNLEKRLSEHQQGLIQGYIKNRCPVELVYSQFFEDVYYAISAERRIKRWSRVKKEALIKGDFDLLKRLAKKNF